MVLGAQAFHPVGSGANTIPGLACRFHWLIGTAYLGYGYIFFGARQSKTTAMNELLVAKRAV